MRSRTMLSVVVVAAIAACAGVSSASAPLWIAEPDKANSTFGQSVAGVGDVNGDGYDDVIVGAPFYLNTGSRTGRVYVFHGSPGGLPGSPSLILEGATYAQGLGYAVTGAGDVNGDGFSDVVIGTKVQFNSLGEAFVYYGSEGGLGVIPPTHLVQGGNAGISFGTLVAGAGDVNGDGYADILIGRPQRNPGWSEPATFLYLGSASGVATTPIWAGSGAASIAGAGDVNGDGFDDVLLGKSTTNTYGGASIFFGSTGGPLSTPYWSYEVPGGVSSNFGASVAGAGDVNGDGFDDILVGETTWSNGQASEGRAYLFNGSAGVPDTYWEWVVEGNAVGAQFGHSVAGAGDVDGDGHADVIVGANQYADHGRAYVYLGSAVGLPSLPAWTADGDQSGAFFGFSVASAGDVSGIGRAAVIVGANQYDHPEDLEGRAYLYQTHLVSVPGPGAPERLSLVAAPNPSPGGTELHYALPERGRVRLAIHDITGRRVAVLADGIEEAGPHAVRWNGHGFSGRLPSGIYVARLELDGRLTTRRLALTR